MNASNAGPQTPEEALAEFVETFEVPVADGSACTVRGSRQDYRYETSSGRTKHQHDFIIYYLNGDCAGDEEVTLTIQKGTKFWTRNLVYDGDLTEAVECARPDKQRCFTLRPDGEVAAFRIGKNNQRFFPRNPYRDAEVDDCGQSCQ